MIIFTVLASCAVVVVVGYVRGNKKIRAAAAAGHAHAPVSVAGHAEPEQDENSAQADSWLWR